MAETAFNQGEGWAGQGWGGEEALGMAKHTSVRHVIPTWCVGTHTKGKVLQHLGQAVLAAQKPMVAALPPAFLETQGMISLPQVESNEVHQQQPSSG